MSAMLRASAPRALLRAMGAPLRRASTAAPEPEAALGSLPLKHTVLHDRHVELGGKMVPFAGYSMPVQYDSEGIKDSHLWVRKNAGLFDISHMGESAWARPLSLLSARACVCCTGLATLTRLLFFSTPFPLLSAVCPSHSHSQAARKG